MISTGDELIDYKKKKKDFQTFDSNKLQIINFLKKYPISIKDLGILKDTFKDVEKFYKTKKSQYDLIISSGGSSFSSGDHTSSYLTKNSKNFIPISSYTAWKTNNFCKTLWTIHFLPTG